MPTRLVRAVGQGTRFGGLKQLEPTGPEVCRFTRHKVDVSDVELLSALE